MLKSYWTMAWRSLRRNKVSSIINIGGLMLGLTSGIIICLYVMYVSGFDRFHTNYKDIHLLELNQDLTGNIVTRNITPAPLGPALRDQLPALRYVVRMTGDNSSLVRNGEKILFQKSIFADPDLFHMMTFPAVEGDPAATLRDGSETVLTESAAHRLFGNEKALGQTILLDNTHPLRVGAVIRDVPANSTIQFDLVLPFTLHEKDKPALSRWDYANTNTWVQLRPGANLASLNRQMNRLFVENVKDKKLSVFAYPLSRLRLYDNFKEGKPDGGKIYLVGIVALLAVFVLLIACVNFMNLSTAMAERRAREVGLRKVLGAPRRVIIGQFLGESLLLSMLALLLSTGLAYLVVPWFKAFTGQPLAAEFGDGRLWIALVILGLFTGLVAGSYPAFYLSRFQPAKVLRRLISIGRGGGGFRKGLVTFQFVISIFLVITAIVCIRQIDYMESRPIGYESSNLIDITADGDLPGHFDLFKNKASNIPGVLDITAGSDNLIWVGSTTNGLDWPGKTPNQSFIINMTWVQYDWTKTTGLKMAEGRDFSPAFGTDSSACLINEAAARKMGLKNPVTGTRLGNNTVIGVVKDFVFNNPTSAPPPLIVYLGKDRLSHFLVRLVNDGQWKEHLGQIEKTAKSLNPAYPFTFRFIDDEHQELFVNDAGIGQMANIFGGMAIFISCLGLFGLAGFLVEKRTKEISIRKVLGATPAGLWFSLSREFLKPVFLGFLLASPLAALLMPKLLATADYHIELSWWMFAVAGVGAIVIALATVSYHGIRATRINPAQSLQTE